MNTQQKIDSKLKQIRQVSERIIWMSQNKPDLKGFERAAKEIDADAIELQNLLTEKDI